MVNAYLLLTVKAGTEKRIAEELRDCENVKDVSIVYGEWDIIVKIEVESVNQLSGFILNVVRPIKGVENSSTLIATE